MKKFGMFIVSAVAAACATVMMLDVTSVEAEAGATITVRTMADAVREMKLTEMYGYNDTVVYEDNEVSIAFRFEKVTEQEWREAWEGFTPEMLSLAEQELIVAYGIGIDDFHDIVVTEGWFTTSASYRPCNALVMV